MNYGIIDLNVIAVRAEKNAKSEMISQFFFGESVIILKKLKKWSYVESNLDNYKGWVRNLHFKSITKKENDKIQSIKKVFSTNETMLFKKPLYPSFSEIILSVAFCFACLSVTTGS